jgi:hypothetical protein
MGNVLGLGISHFPLFSVDDENMAAILAYTLADPDVPTEAKDPANWPPAMRSEWGDDRGAAGARVHREKMKDGLTRARAALDQFKPDVVIVWGDDQYENFHEDVIPAFCVLALPTREVRPWAHVPRSLFGKANVWNEDIDKTFTVFGHPEAGKHFAAGLIEEEFDVAYAYKALHSTGLPHAFMNTVLYLDHEREGFPYPIVPVQVNCYGRKVISYKGTVSRFADLGRPFDPPSPSPRRCFDFGRAMARVAARSPYNVALVASSSWSHAFLVDKTWRLYPDIPSDRRLYDALLSGDVDVWRSVSVDQIESAGQQEMLNWFCLAGAMSELKCPLEWSEFVETYVFNSNKVTALFAPYQIA